MADVIRKMRAGHKTSDIDDTIDEVLNARGDYTTLSERLSGIESEQESQGVAVDEDRAALVEIVDGGAKNFLQNTATSQTISGVTFTVNADKSITLSGTAEANITSFFICRAIPALTGNMVLSGCPAGGSFTTYRLDILDGTASGTVRFVDIGEGMEVDWSLITTGTYTARIRIQSGTTVDGLIFKPMLCTKAAWDISQEYQQYIPSNEELAENKVNVILTAIPSGVSLTDFANSLPVGVHHCFYNSANNAPDVPVSVHGYVEIHKYSAVTGDMAFNPISMTYQVNKYRKILIGGVWRNWVVFTGAELEGAV